MKGLSTEQNVHKSMNIVHDLATLAVLAICYRSLTIFILQLAHAVFQHFFGGRMHKISAKFNQCMV